MTNDERISKEVARLREIAGQLQMSAARLTKWANNGKEEEEALTEEPAPKLTLEPEPPPAPKPEPKPRSTIMRDVRVHVATASPRVFDNARVLHATASNVPDAVVKQAFTGKCGTFKQGCRMGAGYAPDHGEGVYLFEFDEVSVSAGGIITSRKNARMTFDEDLTAKAIKNATQAAMADFLSRM